MLALSLDSTRVVTWWKVSLIILSPFLLLECASSASPSLRSEASVLGMTAAPTEPQKIVVGDSQGHIAPDFLLYAMDGRQFTLQSYRDRPLYWVTTFAARLP